MNHKQFLKCKVLLQIEYLKLKYGENYEFKDTAEKKIETDKASEWAKEIINKIIKNVQVNE